MTQHTNTDNKIIIIIIFIIVIIIIRHSVLLLVFIHIFLTSPILSFCGWLAGGFPAATGVWGNRNVRSHRRRYVIF